jgi:putative ABC transport system ATP-binding protein
MLSPSSGEMEIDGKPVQFRRKGRLLRIRRSYIGFVFQHAQLLPFLTIRENLMIVGENAGLGYHQLAKRSDELLDRLGVADLRHKKPATASAGERQRVAVARALIHSPPILLADEPTAALDWENGQKVVELLTAQAKCENAALVTVTHDMRLVPMFDRALHIDSGRLVGSAQPAPELSRAPETAASAANQALARTSSECPHVVATNRKLRPG